jgi:hypothetical protein
MRLKITLVVLAGLLLTACGLPFENKINDPRQEEVERRGRITGEDGIVLFGSRNRRGEEATGGGLAVNNFLWRASLDTVGFMPLSAADPFGGVIITDWYASPDSPSERFKVTVYILDRQLRADGVKAGVFRQTRDLNGNWVDAEVNPKTAIDLENAILTRARQMRMDSASVK